MTSPGDGILACLGATLFHLVVLPCNFITNDLQWVLTRYRQHRCVTMQTVSNCGTTFSPIIRLVI